MLPFRTVRHQPHASSVRSGQAISFPVCFVAQIEPVLGDRTPCQLDPLKKLRCVRTVSAPNFMLTRHTGEAAASRRTLRVLQDARRIAGYGIARAAVQAMLVSATRFGRTGGIRRRLLPRNARFKHSARLKVSREVTEVHVAAQLSSQADKSRRALARRRSRLRAAPTARARHVGCQFAPAASRWSRQPPCR